MDKTNLDIYQGVTTAMGLAIRRVDPEDIEPGAKLVPHTLYGEPILVYLPPRGLVRIPSLFAPALGR